jgi:hypothetical protein
MGKSFFTSFRKNVSKFLHGKSTVLLFSRLRSQLFWQQNDVLWFQFCFRKTPVILSKRHDFIEKVKICRTTQVTTLEGITQVHVKQNINHDTSFSRQNKSERNQKNSKTILFP